MRSWLVTVRRLQRTPWAPLADSALRENLRAAHLTMARRD